MKISHGDAPEDHRDTYHVYSDINGIPVVYTIERELELVSREKGKGRVQQTCLFMLNTSARYMMVVKEGSA